VNRELHLEGNGLVVLRGIILPLKGALIRALVGHRKVAGGAAGWSTPVIPVHYTGHTGAGLGKHGSGFRAREEARFSSGGCGFDGWYGKSAGGQFARRSPPRAQYGDGKSLSFEMERRNGPRSSSVVLVLLRLERVGSLVVIIVVVFVEVALIGEVLWIVLTPLGANGSALVLLFWY
jgi:hypothetical protein